MTETRTSITQVANAGITRQEDRTREQTRNAGTQRHRMKIDKPKDSVGETGLNTQGVMNEWNKGEQAKRARKQTKIGSGK